MCHYSLLLHRRQLKFFHMNIIQEYKCVFWIKRQGRNFKMSLFLGIPNLFFILKPHQFVWQRTLHTSAWSYYHEMITDFPIYKKILIIFFFFFFFFFFFSFLVSPSFLSFLPSFLPTVIIQTLSLTLFYHVYDLIYLPVYKTIRWQ